MNSEEYIKLYQKYIAGKCTGEEEKKLFEYQDSFRLQDVNVASTSAEEDKVLRKKIFKRIKQGLVSREVPVIKMYRKYAAAILVILSIGIIMYIIVNRDNRTGEGATDMVLKPISVSQPDPATPMLTLADGSVISLDQTANGILNDAGNTEIRKTQDGEIVYNSTENPIETDVAPNKIFIPKGYQYKLTLADGTKVWLNSASTLTYPSNFSGNERHVELSGEGYFEVAKNEGMPFIVTANGLKVNVLGTHFNISAYNEEQLVKTTLVEGAVRLSHGNQAVILKPGQQGILGKGSEEIMVSKVNVRYALAWKEGYFLFKDDQLEDVMKQISRWYNVTVEYRGSHLENKRFGGIYAKTKKLKELLQGLENTGLVKFNIIENTATKERRVIVMD